MIKIFGNPISWMLCLLFVSLFVACQQENEKLSSDPNISLRFSSDTIHFDTIFTTVGSITKRLTVYNKSNNAVNISSIALGDGPNSAYSIYLNGIKGKQFENQQLMGMDSLLLLVEVKIDPSGADLPFLVIDSIRFLTNGNLQDIKLQSWGQDAYFMGKTILPCDTTWTSKKPIVLLDSVLVPESCSLTISEGTKIYARPSSALLVAGSLLINGTVENPVKFTNDRLDIENAYGQWGGIIFLMTSNNNIINHSHIRNSIYGIYIGTPDEDNEPDLVLSNVIIENAAVAGLVAYNSDVHATNILINNCGEFTLANLAGGNYYYNHCTFDNSFAGINIPRNSPSVVITNYIQTNDLDIKEELNFEIHNSIIYGNLKDELLLDSHQDVPFNLLVNHSLLKTSLISLDINKNILNQPPKYINFHLYDYRPAEESPVIDKGDVNYKIFIDLAGNDRDELPDIGAYEFILTE